MSRIADELYFAPGIRFADLDFQGGRLPEQFSRRISGFYLEPSIALGRARKDFASGVLAVCAIDALALVMTGTSAVSARIIGFCRKIPALAGDQCATMFCEHFRNGLVHEARVKNGSEFSTDIGHVAALCGGRLVVNPLLLSESVGAVLHQYVDLLHHDVAASKAFHRKIRRKFRYELEE